MARLIVFEGLDRSGKTTQARLLAERLNALYISFPARDTPVGTLVDKLLRSQVQMNDQVVHLLFAANRWQLSNRIKTTLEEGKDVILDRYFLSGAAYSMAKGLSKSWCLASQQGLPKMDLLIYLESEPQACSQRADFGQQLFERLQFQERVREHFDKLIDEYKGRRIAVSGLDIPQVHQLVLAAVTAL